MLSLRPVFEAIFWTGLGATLYAYAAFPALALLVTRGRRRVEHAGRTRPDVPISVIIPAFNEERHIARRIRNVLEGEYSGAPPEVIVVSDASTDGTDAIVREFAGAGVRLLVQERRRGKTAGLNRAVAEARGDILVFTDANASYQADTIETLAGYFRNPTVGLVSGYTRYTQVEGEPVGEATNAYTTLERILKRAESRWGCCVGADGAIFAMRRSLYRTLRDDDINDFVLPLAVIDQGYDCLLADDAYCAEHPGKDLETEFQRQARITNRTLRALRRHLHLLNPLRFPRFAFFLFSHKLMRFLAPVGLVAAGVAVLPLAWADARYRALAVMGAMALVLAAWTGRRSSTGAARTTPGRLLRVLSVFLTTNLAVLDGWRRFLGGRTDTTWQHDRSSEA